MKPRATWLLGTAVVIVYGCVIAASIHKPLLGGDLVNWRIHAKSFSHIHDLSTVHPAALAITLHPPLHLHLMESMTLLFGSDTRLGFHLYGQACVLIVLALLLYLVRQTAQPEAITSTSLLALIIFLLHPFTIQGSLILELDTTLVPIMWMGSAVVFHLCTTRPGRISPSGAPGAGASGPGRRPWVALGCFLALILWTKFIVFL